MYRLVALMCVLAVVLGCSKKKTQIEILPKPEVIAPIVEPVAEPEPEPEPEPVAEPLWKPDNIMFEFDSYVLSKEGRKLLGTIGARMISGRIMYLTINGYACPIGTEAYNLSLSDERARACLRYLVDYGVEASRIDINAYGEEAAFLVTVDPEYYASNRRSEFSVSLDEELQ